MNCHLFQEFTASVHPIMALALVCDYNGDASGEESSDVNEMVERSETKQCNDIQYVLNTVHLAHPATNIPLPPVTLHASGAKPGSRCAARAYSVIC